MVLGRDQDGRTLMRIVPLTLRQANDFVEAHHRHSARTSNDGGKFAIGLESEGRLIGVAIVGRPVSRMLQEMDGPGAAEITRLCVSPGSPKGACSRLYVRAKRIWQLMGGESIISYTLARESGASLRGAGGKVAKVVRAERWSRRDRERVFKEIEEEKKLRWTFGIEQVPA